MLNKVYDPQANEDDIYSAWEESGAFIADASSHKEPFSIVLPPPNATGTLHVGNSMMIALEDIFIRFARMNGKETLWVPGTDHAAIATENRVILNLVEEGISKPRETLGRDGLLEEIQKFTQNSRTTISGQVRKMGASCDWSKEGYTMEPTMNRCVYEVFNSMYNDGLIYRGHRIVNWDPNLQTNVSDEEVEYEDQIDAFYTFQYGPFEIGTVRPETKFGDKYVVVHPDDDRYSQFKHGDTFECEWINGPITATVIKDEAADPTMGSGAMTITPWHSLVDNEIASRHNLDAEQVIDFNGNLLPIAGEFSGMSINEAREKIVVKLQGKGLVVKIDEQYQHAIATNSRGGGIIEPQVREQWFIDVNKPVVDWKNNKMSLKDVMKDVVTSSDITIIPERFNKTYFSWIDNLRDWCISRQIWWGHQIPVWYKEGETFVGVLPPEGEGWQQDPDTLDTWFSSGTWTWSTLIDKQKAQDYTLSLQDLLDQSPNFNKFHPTTVIETGYDILFFWVARMILMTTYVTGQVPFKTVYLHGLIRGKDGKKMSKSRPETSIDPLEIIPEYGADALRMSMIVGQTPGNDMRLSIEKIAGYRNFINKLWNASRYVLLKCEEVGFDPHSALHTVEPESLADKALLYHLEQLTADVTSGLTGYRLSETGEKLYSFTWEFFCDWYLELSKGELNPAVLIFTLRRLLTLLHPYCPFVTEAIWSHCHPIGAGMLIVEPWPALIESPYDFAATDFQAVIDVITAIRSIRSEQNIPPHKHIAVTLYSSTSQLFIEQAQHIKKLARVDDLQIAPSGPALTNVASQFLRQTEVHVSLEGLIDKEAEQSKLTAEKAKLEGFIKGIEAKLSNEQFTANAPGPVIALEHGKLASNKAKLEKIIERLQSL